MITDTLPPQATEVEEIVLAGLMTDYEAFYKTVSILSPASFYNDKHRMIYESIQKLATAGKPHDLIMVTEDLKTSGKLDAVGGAYAVTQICSKSVRSYNIEHHAKIVAQTFIQRELIRIGRETVTQGFDGTLDINDQIDGLKAKLNEIENIAFASNGGKQQIDVLSAAFIEIEQDCINEQSGKPAGISTGLTILNQSTGGWRDTNLIILAARPGIGKTSLALYFAKMAAKSGHWVNFYGLEMTSEDLMRIMISGESGVSRSDLRDGKLQEQQWDEINTVAGNLEKLPIIWYDDAGINANQINANTRKNVKRGRCDMLVIDYLQLMSTTDKRLNREQQISDITRTLKRTALEMKIPIICLAQLNREASEGRPQLHHLRESGAIEQDADIVIFPWRDQDEKYQMTIAKNRRGKTGTFEIWANEEMTKFDNMNPNFIPKTTVVRSYQEAPF